MSLPAETLVEITSEGEGPIVASWAAFRRDNADDDTIDWPAVARTIARGETWRDGGGAAPAWSVRKAPAAKRRGEAP